MPADLPSRLESEGWRRAETFQEDGRFGIHVLERPGRTGRGLLKQRLGRDDHTRRAFAHELAVLRHVRVDPPLALPGLLDAGDDWYLAEFSEGERLPSGTAPSDDRVELLIAGLRALRASRLPAEVPRLAPPPRIAQRNLLIKVVPGLAPDHVSRREAAGMLLRGRALLGDTGARAVPSHGDFTVTNLLFEADRLVLTDLESMSAERNGFHDAVHLVHQALVRYADWTWHRRLLNRVYRERLDEGLPPSEARRQLEATLFFSAVLKAGEAFVLDGVPAPRWNRAPAAWLRPGRPGAAGKRVPVRLDNLRVLASPRAAAALLDDLTGAESRS